MKIFWVNLMHKLVVILTLMFLTACASKTSYLPVTEEFNKAGKTLQVTVNNYTSTRELNKHTLNPSKGLKGQAIYAKEDLICDINIVRPKNINLDDNYALTLGHELMHCLYGNYHINFED